MDQKPLYEMVSDSIRKLLIQNHLREGDNLPGEFELMKEYSVGRETIRRALKILVEEGLIIRRPGKGTKVCRRIKPDNIEKVVSFSSEIVKLGMVPSTKIKFIRIIKADEELAALLSVKTGHDIVSIRRICYADDMPLAIEEDFIDKVLLRNFDKGDFSGSIYETLTTKYGLVYSKMKQSIASVILNQTMAEELECRQMSAFELSRTIFNEASKPFYFLKFFIRGDLYTMDSEIKF
ncbi:MAG: GntR family transcriptional regulator [Thermotogota bacterium]|nr:GntR family transcriptional regulator [Thermotogota bacterium]